MSDHAEPAMSADEVAEILGLEPHPEGGHYVETWRDAPAAGGRPSGSAIYFLLRAGNESARHRVDAAETWHYYAGAPLELLLDGPDGSPGGQTHVLGPDLAAGQRPQYVVPADAWQAARTTGGWTLVGCTVSPAFTFEGFELAGDDGGHTL